MTMRTNRYPSRQIFRERTMLLHILYLVGITAEAM
ncbi:TPA: trimeric intracellular cation channel family protein, partial [Escherichia coli]|nr:trimeric intracellular cation channel family protein [Escherichia coli]